MKSKKKKEKRKKRKEKETDIECINAFRNFFLHALVGSGNSMNWVKGFSSHKQGIKQSSCLIRGFMQRRGVQAPGTEFGPLMCATGTGMPPW